MVSLDEKLYTVFSKKGKFGSNELLKVANLLQESSILRDSDIVRGSKTFKDIWEQFNSQANDYAVLSIALLISAVINTGKSLKLETPEKLQSLLLRLNQIYQKKTTTLQHKSYITNLIFALVINISDGSSKKTIAPLLSILTWKDLNIDLIDKKLDKEFDLRSTYENELAKLEKLGIKEKVQLSLLSQWISLLIDELLNLKFKTTEEIELGLSIIKLLAAILGQLPTRKFIKALVEHKKVSFYLDELRVTEPKLLTAIATLKYFITFPINEFSGLIRSSEEIKEIDSEKLEFFQAFLYENFKDLSDMIFCSSSKLYDRQFVELQLGGLSSLDLDKIIESLNYEINSTDEDSTKINFILSKLQPSPDLYDIAQKFSGLPDLTSLDGIDSSHIYIIPSLLSMNLSVNDFLIKNVWNIRIATFAELSQHFQRVVKRFERKKNQPKISGSSKHAIKLPDLEVKKGLNGHFKSTVKLNINQLDENTVKEWNELGKGDVVYITGVNYKDASSPSPFRKLGIQLIEPAVIEEVLNNAGAPKSSNKSKSFILNIRIEKQIISDGGNGFLLVKIPAVLNKSLKSLESQVNLINYSLEETLPEWISESILTFKLPKVSATDALEHTTDDTILKKRKIKDGEAERTTQGSGVAILDDFQEDAFKKSIRKGLTVINGISGSGKRFLTQKIVEFLSTKYPNETTLIVSKSKQQLGSLFDNFESSETLKTYINLTDSPEKLNMKVEKIAETLNSLLSTVDDISSKIGLDGAYGNDTRTALNFFKYEIQPKWKEYLLNVRSLKSEDEIIELFPFKNIDWLTPLDPESSGSENLDLSVKNYIQLKDIFSEISRLSPAEFLSKGDDKIRYFLQSQCNIIGITSGYDLGSIGVVFQNVIVLGADETNLFETLQPILELNNETLQRFILIGDIAKTQSIPNFNLFETLVLKNSSVVNLQETYNQREVISKLIEPSIIATDTNETANAGILDAAQIIQLDSSEMENIPQFYQNVTEAEFAIDFYIYTNLIGYSNASVTILTPFKSQKILLEEVAYSNKVSPEIATIDTFSGFERDIILLSLVRSGNEVSFNPRTLRKALSFAKKGLYVIASTGAVEYLKQEKIFDTLLDGSKTLKFVSNEVHGQLKRKIGDKIDFVEIKTTDDLRSELVKLSN